MTSKGSLMSCCQESQGNTSSSGLPFTWLAPESVYSRTCATAVLALADGVVVVLLVLDHL